MIRIVPTNRGGFRCFIEYDLPQEERAILTLLGVTESGVLKLGKKRNWGIFANTYPYVDEFGDITYYFNADGVEVAHSLMKLDNCPYKLGVYETPRQWGDEVKEAHRITKLNLSHEISLTCCQRNEKVGL